MRPRKPRSWSACWIEPVGGRLLNWFVLRASTGSAEALQEFQAARDETLRFASEEGPNLVSRSATHLVLGPLNGVEALLLIADHGRRHAEQMREAASGR